MIYKLTLNYKVRTDISNLYSNIARMAHYPIWPHTLVRKGVCLKMNLKENIVKVKWYRGRKNNSWLSVLVSFTAFFSTGFLSQIIYPLIIKQHVAWKGSVACEIKTFPKTHHGHKLKWIQRGLSSGDACFNNFLICCFLGKKTGFLCLIEKIRS